MKEIKGFTLIEVLIALIILAGAMIILTQSWAGSMRAIRKARIYSAVNLLLQKKMVEFEVKSKDKTVEEIDSESESGDFGSDFPEYTWEIKTKPFTLPDVMPPKTNGENQDDLARTILKTMADYFEKAVREVSVTVIYKTGDNTLKYSLSTVFIDYSKEVPSGF